MNQSESRIPQHEEWLIERCRLGDKNAFGKLVSSQQSFAFRVAFGMLLSEDDAKDAVQDSFVKIWKNIGGYRSGSQFSTWMYKIVVNTCLDYLKSAHRKYAESISETAHSTDLEATIINRNLAEHILALSNDLPEKQRIVFVLKDIQDFSIEEISQILKISTGLVKSNLYYARKRIRENYVKLEKGRKVYELQTS